MSQDEVYMLSNVSFCIFVAILKLDTFKPAAIDYSQPGNLSSAEDGTGEVSLTLPSTTVFPSFRSQANLGWRIPYFQRADARS